MFVNGHNTLKQDEPIENVFMPRCPCGPTQNVFNPTFLCAENKDTDV